MNTERDLRTYVDRKLNEESKAEVLRLGAQVTELSEIIEVLVNLQQNMHYKRYRELILLPIWETIQQQLGDKTKPTDELRALQGEYTAFDKIINLNKMEKLYSEERTAIKQHIQTLLNK
jgi:hypothetical protein